MKKSIFLLSLIAGIVWLNFFHYGVAPQLERPGVSVYISDLINQCNSITEGMSIYTVDNMISSRNKRAEWNISGMKTVKYWIVKNPVSEHYPKGDVCSVDFDRSDHVVEASLIKFEN